MVIMILKIAIKMIKLIQINNRIIESIIASEAYRMTSNKTTNKGFRRTKEDLLPSHKEKWRTGRENK